MSSCNRRCSEDIESDPQQEQPVLDNSKVAGGVIPRMLEVIRREFNKELQRREKELDDIDTRLKEALRVQHLLRYAVVSSYYGVRSSMEDWPDGSSSRHIDHPAIAGLKRKKKPKKNLEERLGEAFDSDGQLDDKGSFEDDYNLPTKIPRYIPPATKKVDRETTSPTRGSHTKKKYRIIVGNVSRWIPIDCRDDEASHKWMVYARTPPNEPPLSQFVSKVRFFLHQSYRPFDVVEVVSPPFRLSRRGWGEFPIRVQVHFHNPLNKPIDIIHHLVLDRTKSGRQALGAETIVEGWLCADDDERSEYNKDAKGYKFSRAWEEDSQGHDNEYSSSTAMGIESGSVGVNSSSHHNFSAEKKVRCDDMPWEASENVPHVFNECTLMSEEDIKKEIESNSSDSDMESESVNNPGDIKESPVEKDTSEEEPDCEKGDGLVKQEFIEEEPLTIEEWNVDKLVQKNQVMKEEAAFYDVIDESLSIKEEVVIEDGCFPRPNDEDTIADVSLCHSVSGEFCVKGSTRVIPKSVVCAEQPQVTELKVENTVTNFVNKGSFVKSSPLTLRFSLTSVHGENVQSQKPTSSSNTKQGLPKGKSLLKNPSIRPGTSILIQSPPVSCVARNTQPLNHLALKSYQLNHQTVVSQTINPVTKPSVDPKSAMFARNYSKLKIRVHNDVEAAVNQLFRALPIVTPTACDPTYRAMHFYAANSLDTFFSWPVAKQRAAEWTRAGEVRKLLSAQGFSEEECAVWTTKDLMMWGRLRGYTPLCPKIPHNLLHFSSIEGHTDVVALNLSSTFSEPKIANKWLSSLESEKLSPQKNDDEEEIDVVSVGESSSKKLNSSGHKRVGLGARAAGGHKVILLGMETTMGNLSRLVDEFSRKIGVVTSCPEEIIPCVFYPAAQRILIESVKSFMNDLVRRSYSCALRRASERSDISLAIEVEDVRRAVLNRQEFDILTNEGLSAEPDDPIKLEDPL